MVLKTEVCRFSGLKIYPGHGMRLTKVDSQTYLFLNAKCKRLFNLRLRPAKLAWTTQYRKAHKKVRTETSVVAIVASVPRRAFRARASNARGRRSPPRASDERDFASRGLFRVFQRRTPSRAGRRAPKRRTSPRRGARPRTRGSRRARRVTSARHVSRARGDRRGRRDPGRFFPVARHRGRARSCREGLSKWMMDHLSPRRRPAVRARLDPAARTFQPRTDREPIANDVSPTPSSPPLARRRTKRRRRLGARSAA